MNRIKERFRLLKKHHKKALIPFITAGDPDLETTRDLVLTMAEKGADIIELGVPFSDPMADGPTIQASSQRALNRHTSLLKILSLVKRIRQRTGVPLVLMTYLNPVYKYGFRQFVNSCKNVGVDGVIIPDLITEEADNWINIAKEKELSTIFLASPTSPLNRIRMIAKKSTGFLYYVSLTGVTGMRESLSKTLVNELERIKKFIKIPLACGFGISNAVQARKVARHSDGVIVGSAIIKIIEKSKGRKKILRDVGEFISVLKRAI